MSVDLKLPWHTVVDPDGPTEIRNREGKIVAEVNREEVARVIVGFFNCVHRIETGQQ